MASVNSNSSQKKVVVGWKPKPKKVLPQCSIKGKFIKLNVRTYPNKKEGQPAYKFYTGMMVIDADTKNQLGQWGDALGYTSDSVPWFTSNKEFNGKPQESIIINFDIKGENLKEEELTYLTQLSDIKADITCELGAECEEYTDKQGEQRTKFKLQLMYNTTFQQVQSMQPEGSEDLLSDEDAPLKKHRGRPSKKQKVNTEQ